MEESEIESAGTGGARAKVRGPRTRKLIEKVAHELFLKRGFHETSMGDIAEAAEVSAGTVHYHFQSKEEIVFAFYRSTLDRFELAADKICAESSSLDVRIRRLMAIKLLELRPYKPFLRALLRFSLDPDSEISPFSTKSRDIRDRVVGVFAKTLRSSERALPSDLQRRLPVLLWLVQMGLIFVWLHDTTPNEQKTARVLEKSMKVLMPLLSVAKMPLVGKLIAPLFELLDEYVPLN